MKKGRDKIKEKKRLEARSNCVGIAWRWRWASALHGIRQNVIFIIYKMIEKL